MDFFIKEENVRPGNRGGRDQFKWDNIRLMNNKERESYLGVTQSIGFLDKGGKWRKRDWWLKNDSLDKVNKDDVKREIDIIKKEEERLMRETLFPGQKEKIQNKGTPFSSQNGNNHKAKLTDYEWKELMKKEAKFAPDDTQLFEFYENDDKRAGIGMKPTVSFRTNPYGEADTLTKLEGVNINLDEDKNEKLNQVIEDPEMADNPYLKSTAKKTLVNKYIDAYIKDKKEKTKNDKDKLSHKRERSIEKNDKEDKKNRKDKKDKKEKNEKKNRRSRSRSRDHHKSHKKH